MNIIHLGNLASARVWGGETGSSVMSDYTRCYTHPIMTEPAPIKRRWRRRTDTHLEFMGLLRPHDDDVQFRVQTEGMVPARVRYAVAAAANTVSISLYTF